MKTKIHLIILSLIVVFICPEYAIAKYRTSGNYRVEVIVFSKINKQAIDSENWPILKKSNFSKQPSPQLSLTKLNSINYQEIADSDLQLVSIESKLKKNKYKILYHQAWTQNISKYQSLSQPINIQGGDSYDKNGNIINDASNSDSTNLSELTGNMTITLNKFFNVKLDLLLTQPKSTINAIDRNYNPTSLSDSNYYAFQLLQQRKSRSNEINYIDNPLFGVIYKITKT
jgi:hypothetical protein